jgi:hypothetical protein
MLYNPQWKQDRKPGLDDLIAWLEQHDSNEFYKYNDVDSCLAAQYNASLGRDYEVPFPLRPAFGSFNLKLERIAFYGKHTFGAALERAKKVNDQHGWRRWL